MDTNTGEEPTAAIGSQQSLIHLRDYQQELAVLALKGVNTIIYAGTNAGKTYVALKVVENHLEKNTTGKSLYYIYITSITKRKCSKVSKMSLVSIIQMAVKC